MQPFVVIHMDSRTTPTLTMPLHNASPIFARSGASGNNLAVGRPAIPSPPMRFASQVGRKTREKDATLIKVLKSNLFTLKRSLVTINSSLMSGIKMPCFAE
jgi:hypothetical protein